jgi:hypothetical protein
MQSRTTIGIVLLLVLGLAGGFRCLTDTSVFDHDYRHRAALVRRAERLDSLRSQLPERGVIGYRSTTGDTGEYYMTQYILAPLIVVEQDSITPAPCILLSDSGHGVSVHHAEDD